MKKIQITFVLLFLTFFLLSNLFAQVKLVTELIGKESSEADFELKAVDLKLKLQFINQDAVPILIYKNNFDISHIWVGKKVEDLTSEIFEQSSSVTVLTENIPKIEELKLENFVILSKNEKYETSETIRLFISYDSSKKIAGAISTGKHALRIQFYNWHWNKIESKNKQVELKKYGNIMTNFIISEPMNFTIE